MIWASLKKFLIKFAQLVRRTFIENLIGVFDEGSPDRETLPVPIEEKFPKQTKNIYSPAAEVSDALWRASLAEAAARDVRPPTLGPLCEPGSLPPLPEVDLDALLAALEPSGE